jgi:hypothetical protein
LSSPNLDLTPLQWPLLLAVMSLVAIWCNRERPKRRGEAGEIMRVPLALFAIGIVCSGFFIALAVLSQLYPGADDQGVPQAADPWVAVPLLGFAALGLPLIVAYIFERHRLTPHELHYRTLTRRGVLRWADVTRVRYSRFRHAFRLDATDGRVVRIGGMLRGLPLFARIVNDEVAPHKIDLEAQAVLDAIEAKQLPTQWRS